MSVIVLVSFPILSDNNYNLLTLPLIIVFLTLIIIFLLHTKDINKKLPSRLCSFNFCVQRFLIIAFYCIIIENKPISYILTTFYQYSGFIVYSYFHLI